MDVAKIASAVTHAASAVAKPTSGAGGSKPAGSRPAATAVDDTPTGAAKGAATTVATGRVAAPKPTAGDGATRDATAGADKLHAKPTPDPQSAGAAGGGLLGGVGAAAGGAPATRTSKGPKSGGSKTEGGASADAPPPALAQHATQLAAQAKAQRDAATAAAQAHHTGEDPVAARNAVLGAYYRDAGSWYDPTTGQAYDASFDAATGQVHGSSTTTPLEQVGPHGAFGGDGGAAAPAVPLTTTVTVGPDGQYVVDQRGSRSGTGSSASVQQQVQHSADGSIQRASRTTTDSSQTAGGTRSTSTSDTWGAGGVPEHSETRTTARNHGVEFTHAQVTDHDGSGAVSHQVTTDGSQGNGVTASEVHDVQYSGGTPASERVTREATDVAHGFPTRVTQHDQVTYGADGEPSKVTSDYPSDQRDRPNEILRAANAGSSDPFFAFGRVEQDPGTNDDGTPKGGNVSGPGTTIDYRGIAITVEGADPSLDYPRNASSYTQGTAADAANANGLGPAAKFSYYRDAIDALPPQERAHVKQVRSVDGGGHGAYAWATGDHEIVFFGGNTGSQATLFHESAHTADGRDGAPSEATWQAAAEHDRATRASVLAQIPAGSVVRSTNGDVLNDDLGVDDYGSQRAEGGNGLSRAEDFAEATSQYLQSRRDGGIATYTTPDGKTVTLTFEQLFPERAKLLDAYYDGFAGWQPEKTTPTRVEGERFPDPKQPKSTEPTMQPGDKVGERAQEAQRERDLQLRVLAGG